MYVFSPIVSVEISQKCNLNCIHCMRGKSRNVDITKNILDNFFSELKYTNLLVISGGEPFLNYEQIKLLVDSIKENNVSVKSVLINTNGTIYDERIYNLLSNNFEYIELNISLDSYHINSINNINSDDKNKIINNIISNRNSKFFNEFYLDSEYIINMGNAIDLNVPKVDFSALGYFTMLDEDYLLAGPNIYLDANGYITDGNSSYESRNDINIGNINNNSLSDILINNSIMISGINRSEFLKKMNDIEYYNEISDEIKYIYNNNKIKKV